MGCEFLGYFLASLFGANLDTALKFAFLHSNLTQK